jgi:hypothetical protein
MRALLLVLPLFILTLLSSSGNAGDARPRQIAAVSDSEKLQRTTPNHETYRGYFSDLSEIAGRQNFAAIVDALRHQFDIVESVGLSARVLKFFHTVPIVVDELACLSSPSPKDHPDARNAACYGMAVPEPSQRTSHRVPTVWDYEKLQWSNPDAVDLALDAGRGVVMVRPIMLGASPGYAQQPVILHELLHAYHAKILPQGVQNPAVLLHYNLAKTNRFYPADAYLMTNEKEFFAVTASVFLYGKDSKEPFTRSNLKEKQPDYFNYLVWLFGFDPDGAPTASPIASAD